MLNHLKEEHVKNPPKHGPDSHLAVLMDCFSASLYDGFRRQATHACGKFSSKLVRSL
jgi:hypothetical protein